MDQTLPSSSVTSGPGHRIEFRIDSDTARVGEVRRGLERFAAGGGFTDVQQADIGLCVNEALANVIRHAYSGVRGKPILITAEVHGVNLGAVMRIEIRDWGNGENPAEMRARERDPLTPGGVGLVCLRSLMDEIRFVPQGDGMLLTLVKKREPGPPGRR